MDNIFWIEYLPLGQAIGWTIINSLWQIGIMAIAWRILLWFIPQKQPNLRYGLTLTALVLTTMWVGYSFSEEWAGAKGLVVDNQLVIKECWGEVFGEKDAFISKIVSNDEPNVSRKEGSHPISKNEEKATSLTSQYWAKKVGYFSSKIFPYVPYLAVVWYLGVLLLTLIILGGFFHLNQLRYTGVSMPSKEWLTRFESLKKQMGLTQKVQFLVSEKVAAPITFYFFRPVVLAPIGLFTGLSINQIEVLLLHELAHIRRYDFTINIFQSLIEILFFYHPVVWWMSSELRKEREHCCDDLVISIRNNPLLYAEALTCIQSPNFSLKTSLAMAATGKKGSFSQRIFRLFGQYERQPITLKSTLLLLVLILTGFLIQGFHQPAYQLTDTDTKEITETEDITTSEKENILTKAEHTGNDVTTVAESADDSYTITIDEPLVENGEIYKIPVILKERAIERISHLDRIKDHLEDGARKAITEHFESLKKHFYVNKAENTFEEKEEYPLDNQLINHTDYDLKKGEKVFIDWSISENENHINANKFKKWSDKKIRNLYERNVKAHKLSEKGQLQTQGSFQSHKEFDPLIYTLEKDGISRQLTLKTYVNHQRKIVKQTGIKGMIARKRGQKALKELEKNIPFSGSLSPVKGALPSIVTRNMVSTHKGGSGSETTIGFELRERAEKVLIQVLTREGAVVETLVNQALDAGDYHYTWKHHKVFNGSYQLDIGVNDQLLSQLLEVEDGKKAVKGTGKSVGYSDNCSGLLQAVKDEEVAAVKTLLKSVNPDCTYRGGGEPRSPLVSAARNGNMEIGKLLLQADAGVEYHAKGDETPLIAAASFGHIDFVKLLLAKGADVNGELSGDGTPLIGAVRNGHYEICKLLLDHGADVKLSSSGDENPIYHASRKKDDKFLDLLLEYRAK